MNEFYIVILAHFLALILYLVSATTIYFIILSLFLNFKPVKQILQKVFIYIEKVTGVILVFLGIKVILEK